MKSVFISIIIPAYNEAKRIGVTLEALDAFFKPKRYSYEIIVVNDGSPDDLVSVVKNYQSTIKNLHLIDNKENRGKGYAVKCGMIQARGKYRLFMDADNSVTISNLNRFLMEFTKGSEVVIGSIEIGNQKKDEHNGLIRKVLSKVSKLPVRMLATPNIYDTQRGFKLFSSQAAEIIFPKQTIDRFAFDIELLVIAMANKLAIKELPVAFDNPIGSTVRMSAYVTSLIDLVKISSKNMVGHYYSAQANFSFWRSTANNILVGCLAWGLVLLSVIVMSLAINKALIIHERSVIVTQPPEITTPFTVSELHENTSANAPSWIYDKEPMTKSDTAELLFIAIVIMLLGIDLIANGVTPKMYAYTKAYSQKLAVKKSTRHLPPTQTKIARPLIPHTVNNI